MFQPQGSRQNRLYTHPFTSKTCQNLHVFVQGYSASVLKDAQRSFGHVGAGGGISFYLGQEAGTLEYTAALNHARLAALSINPFHSSEILVRSATTVDIDILSKNDQKSVVRNW